jgi:integrase
MSARLAAERTPTVGTVLGQWYAEWSPMLKCKSREAARSSIRRLEPLAALPVTELTVPVLWAYVEEQARNVGPSTIVLALKWLRRAMGLVWERELAGIAWVPIGKNPNRRIQDAIRLCKERYAHRVKERDAFTLDEAKTVLLCARTGDVPAEMAALVELAFLTGMRRSELRALQWDCVEWQQARLDVRRNFSENELGSVKTGRSRRVLVGKRCVELLRELWERAEGPFVLHRRGEPLSQSYVGHHLAAILDRARGRGVREGLSLHSARHLYVTRGRENMSDAWMQSQVGHSGAQQRRYTHSPTVDTTPDLAWTELSH